MAENSCYTSPGMKRSFRREARSITTTGCRRPWVALPKRRISSASLWCREWACAPASDLAATARLTQWMWSRSGARPTLRRIKSSIPTGRAARWTKRTPPARIRRWQSTKGRETRWTRPTSPAGTASRKQPGDLASGDSHARSRTVLEHGQQAGQPQKVPDGFVVIDQQEFALLFLRRNIQAYDCPQSG